ncbi:DUF5134 domain-containing protein [Nocardia neocaledoniensis]|uniref:DUF5134 domain-containing protein n=1 Tax=Nocardia neocaledoniensis TaxID=236511 RepID=UPI002455A3F5|nr:DUF5134 domain-containing protein [Nocardia neocaledoniensis]
MAEFVQQYALVRWPVVAAFLLALGIVAVRLARGRTDHRADAAADSAHLLMCLVMLAMLVFPAATHPHAVRGLLTALTVAFAALLAERVLGLRAGNATGDGVAALGYHTLAAAAMLYAMAGHDAGHAAEGPSWPAVTLAVLFTLDALLALGTARHGGRWHRFAHPVGAHPLTSALVPHVVMDIGTAFMLIAAIGR